MRRSWLGMALLIAACSSDGAVTPIRRDSGIADADREGSVSPTPPTPTPPAVPPSTCPPPATAAGPEVEIAPEFAPSYRAYALGSVPGVPNPLGGIVVQHDDPNTLLVAGASENPSGAIYAIGVTRDACGHILAFEGTARKIADTPYVDANLVYGPDALLLYTEWPQYGLSQLLPGATSPSHRTDLTTLGISTDQDQGPGGLGFVPPGLGAVGELRFVTWPAGRWYHVGATFSGGLYTIDSLTEGPTLPNNPGGFAYVPAGSPGFPGQSLIVAEWHQLDASRDRVAVYGVDDAGDPIPSTRREFFSRFPRPWGAYFEPVTGDYLFLTWGDGNDRVYLVQGFVPPPDIF